jgi:hypothetical protein
VIEPFSFKPRFGLVPPKDRAERFAGIFKEIRIEALGLGKF